MQTYPSSEHFHAVSSTRNPTERPSSRNWIRSKGKPPRRRTPCLPPWKAPPPLVRDGRPANAPHARHRQPRTPTRRRAVRCGTRSALAANQWGGYRSRKTLRGTGTHPPRNPRRCRQELTTGSTSSMPADVDAVTAIEVRVRTVARTPRRLRNNRVLMSRDAAIPSQGHDAQPWQGKPPTLVRNPAAIVLVPNDVPRANSGTSQTPHILHTLPAHGRSSHPHPRPLRPYGSARKPFPL